MTDLLAALVLVGTVVAAYLFGRWDGRINAKQEEVERHLESLEVRYASRPSPPREEVGQSET